MNLTEILDDYLGGDFDGEIIDVAAEDVKPILLGSEIVSITRDKTAKLDIIVRKGNTLYHLIQGYYNNELTNTMYQIVPPKEQ